MPKSIVWILGMSLFCFVVLSGSVVRSNQEDLKVADPKQAEPQKPVETETAPRGSLTDEEKEIAAALAEKMVGIEIDELGIERYKRTLTRYHEALLDYQMQRADQPKGQTTRDLEARDTHLAALITKTSEVIDQCQAKYSVLYKQLSREKIELQFLRQRNHLTNFGAASR